LGKKEDHTKRKNNIKTKTMKKIMLIIAIAFTGCKSVELNKNYVVVTSAKSNVNKKLPAYRYTVKDKNGELYLWLNDKYSIGDTLTIIKKNK
jgi:PhoPQ-activated pathogenicity-related protein